MAKRSAGGSRAALRESGPAALHGGHRWPTKEQPPPESLRPKDRSDASVKAETAVWKAQASACHRRGKPRLNKVLAKALR